MKEIKLPLEEAVALHARENWERDKRQQLDPGTWKECRSLYEEEALELFKTTGVGYDPEYPDHHLIRLE